ncbi:MAG: DUF5686 and carboxypeptidase regulatory-like domain-containing protein [Muribaculaceae bacterium]|nr:DUF5686 and carboxypeptidase regulatory-like domain-containing protein [Muribaculaceae bacterium]
MAASWGACVAQSAWEQSSGYYLVRGIVVDSITDAPLPYASVTLPGTTTGAVADSKGVFEFRVPAGAKKLQASMVGYASRVTDLRQSSHNMYVMRLPAMPTDLRELVVKRKKYSKKNNPAVDFVRRIKSMADSIDPRRNPYYGYQRYERITLAMNNFEASDSSFLARKLPFLAEHVDTSEISGKPVLPVSVRETLSRVNFRRSPQSEKTVILGQKSDGIDEIADKASMQTFMEDVLREIDLYSSDITLMQNRFVSPLSRIGPDFYKYYLTDTVAIDGGPCAVLSFYPHNKAMFGFTGHLYVPLGDSTMFIRQADMRVPRDINLNFVDNMLISQTFERAPDGSRLKTRDDLVMEMSLVPGTPQIYVRRSTVYADHSFTAPADSAALFGTTGPVVRDDSAAVRDENWWNHARLKPMGGHGESNVGLLMRRLRSIPAYYWGEKVLKTFVVGYIATGSNSRFDIGPLNTFVSYNPIEGLRLRAGGVTTAHLNKRLFARGAVAYGFRDHRWKYMGELEYSFVDKAYHSREFPVHALRFTSSYDLNFIGQQYRFTNPDNMFLSLKRLSDNMATYRRLNSLSYILELQNNFSVTATVANTRQEATPMVPLVNGHGHAFAHYDETTLQLQLRYAPGEKFYQTTSERIPVNLDAPVVMLSHTMALSGLPGSDFTINKTELHLQKRFWLSAFGYIDTRIGGAHVWSAAPYINLIMPNANLSYTIQPESFALINPMEFVNDSQLDWEITYWANGAILNSVPLLKRLKLREVFGFRGAWGHLSAKNDPASNPDLFRFAPGATTRAMDRGPYMEASAGVDNILRCLRLEYVWRLSYLDVPYKIDRGGLRLSFHMTF